ncbi:MAG: alpha/beta hydrolase [Reyranella sp.]|uniref:alpha/beta fold hydrolase n=1 Tax=Reyranella sp. TaxID=1929291 RepID=UPI001AC75533|nr:alpha/beta hydrolase [Reyranella sp.]MBN9089336.1 alpha/beta hydrolase [Reyranella sp.]
MKCELDTATIDYEVHGEGRPILFLHGWTMNRRVETADYEPIFAARPWRRLYADLPGMGLSVSKGGIRTQDDMLAAVLAFIDRVLPGERFVLAGTSGGGYLARAIAARRREQVAGLLLRVPAIIADTAKRTLPSGEPLVRNESAMAALDPAERAAMGTLLVEAPAYIERARRRFKTLVQPAIEGTAPWVLEMRADPKRYSFSFDLAAAEKGFTKPALIITARQDTTVGYRDAWQILESYPRATFVVVDRATHGWPTESTDLLAALVDDWLERIEKSEQSI